MRILLKNLTTLYNEKREYRNMNNHLLASDYRSAARAGIGVAEPRLYAIFMEFMLAG
jgi:hypothetical protein